MSTLSTPRTTWREREMQKERQQREAVARAADDALRARLTKTEANFPTTMALPTQMTVMDGGSFAEKAALWQADDETLYRHARSARERKIIRDTVSFLRSGGAQPRYRPEEEMDAQSDAPSGAEDVSPSTLYPPHGRRGTYTEPDAEGFRTVTRRTRAKPRTLTEAELARKYRAEFFGEEDEEEEDVNGDLTDRNQRRDFY
jgi:hypothetical protein